MKIKPFCYEKPALSGHFKCLQKVFFYDITYDTAICFEERVSFPGNLVILPERPVAIIHVKYAGK